MINRNQLSYLTLLIFIAIGCGVDQDTTGAKSQYDSGERIETGSARIVWHYSTDPDDPWLNVVDIAIRDSSVYILDHGSYQLKEYSATGKRLRSIGKRGTGPGEFNSPVSVAVTSRNVVVSEQRGTVLHRFSRSLEHLETFSAGGVVPIDMVGYIDDTILLSGISTDTGSNQEAGVLVKSMDGDDANRFPISMPNLPDVVTKAPRGIRGIWNASTVDSDGDVWCVAFTYANIINCSRERTVIWNGSLDGIQPFADIDNPDTGLPLPSNRLIRDIVVDSTGGHVYVLLGTTPDSKDREVRQYTLSGSEINRFELPFETKRFDLADKGRLAIVSTNGDMVVVVELILRKKSDQ